MEFRFQVFSPGEMSLHQREYWYSCTSHTLFPFFSGSESLTNDLCCEPSPIWTIVWEVWEEKHTSVLGALIYSSSDMMFATGAEAKITSQIPCYDVAYLSPIELMTLLKTLHFLNYQASWFLSCPDCSNSQTETWTVVKMRLSRVEGHIYYLHRNDSHLSLSW